MIWGFVEPCGKAGKFPNLDQRVAGEPQLIVRRFNQPSNIDLRHSVMKRPVHRLVGD